VMVRHPEQRSKHAARIATWVLAFLVIGALNVYWYRDSRTYADAVAAAVLSYRAKTGAYPRNLEQIGIRADDAFRKSRLVYGVYTEGHKTRLSLSYKAPFAI